MKIGIRITVVFMVLSMLATGCSNNIAKASEQSAESDTNAVSGKADDRINYEIPVNDYGGYNFVFLVREFDGNGYWGSQEIYAEEQNAVPINDAVGQ
jgi:hypothetical protein